MAEPEIEKSIDEKAADPEWRGVWNVLGYRWAFHILRHLSEQDTTFNELVRTFDGLNANTLSTRLDCLQDEQLVLRTVEESSPPSVTYSLTEKGRDLATILDEIDAFEKRYS